MKNAVYTPVVLTVIIVCTSFYNKENKSKAPPGTIRINDTLFIDKTEIGNIHWREFEYWTLGYAKDSLMHIQMLPDSTVWQTNRIALREYYFRHPSYNYYPVVGISYEQAIKFCEWRSDRVNELYERHPSENPFPGKKYKYRLPTIDEWEMFASGGKDINKWPYGLDSTLTEVKRKWVRSFNCIYNSIDSLNISRELTATIERPDITAPIESFIPNGFGLYNTIGNVSEMTAIKGIAKGGNYSMSVKECTIKSEQFYSDPTSWLGFRCVCDIIN